MSTEAENQTQTEAAEGSLSFLDRAIEATTQTPADTTKELFSVLAEQALSGTVTWDKNVTKTIENAISEIDKKLSKQLSEVMQQKDLQKLEGSWRGLQKLVKESELGRDLKIKMVDFSQEELLDQFEDAPAIDRSPLFNAVTKANLVLQVVNLTVHSLATTNSVQKTKMLPYFATWVKLLQHVTHHLLPQRTLKCSNSTTSPLLMKANLLLLVLIRRHTQLGTHSVKVMTRVM